MKLRNALESCLPKIIKKMYTHVSKCNNDNIKKKESPQVQA
jgi:hypothetical protein